MSEPKYKEGDWVVIEFDLLPDKVRQIASIDKLPYGCNEYWTTEGSWFGDGTKSHLWTIADAKDGDLLVFESGVGLGNWYCIFKSLEGKASMTVHCYLSINGEFEINKKLHFYQFPPGVNPVTKEQRDFLFAKMKEEGYEWDAEKKEIRTNKPFQVAVSLPEEKFVSVIADKEKEKPQTLTEAYEKGVDISRPLSLDSRLTEFEHAVGLEIFDPPFNEEQISIIKKESEQLLAIARKSFTANEKKIGRKIEGSTMTIFGLSASKKEIIERIIDTWNGEDE